MIALGLTYVDFLRPRTDKEAAMGASRAKPVFIGVSRRLVALLAIVVWVLGTFICPDAADALGATHQPVTHEHHGGSAAGHVDLDSSCQVLAHTSGVLQSVAPVAARHAGVQDFTHAVILSAPDLTPAAGTAIGVVQLLHGPPRTRSARFATFWSHAPPLL